MVLNFQERKCPKINACITFAFVVCSCDLADAYIHQGEKKGVKNYAMVFLPIAYYAVCLWRFGFSMAAIKGFLLLLVLLYASESDIKARQASDIFPLLLLVIAMMDISADQLPGRLAVLLAAGLPQLLVAIKMPGKWGGGDIKVSAAGAAVLGLRTGLWAMVVGLICALITTLTLRKIRHKKENGIPMVPYFTVGFAILFLV